MPNKSEIESLVYLLEDPDPEIQEQVRSRLFELGESAVPLLDQQQSQSSSKDEQQLIKEIIQWITYSSVEEDFMDILDQGMDNLKQLEDAAFVLARFVNPTLRACEYKRKLDRFAAVIKDEVRYALDESQKMHILLDFVFQELGFKGNTTNYYSPENSCLDKVIATKRGLPISLALVVLCLSRRLDLSFYGINMPIHFMLGYQTETETVLIDPFDSGKAVSYDQCYYFLKQNGLEPKSEHFKRASELQILARCIRNLIKSFEKNGQIEQTEGAKKLLNTVEMMGHF